MLARGIPGSDPYYDERRFLRPDGSLVWGAFGFGGDEFAIGCDDASTGEIERITERVLKVISRPWVIGELELSVTASGGIVLAGKDAAAKNLLRDSDAAMNHRFVAAGRWQVSKPCCADIDRTSGSSARTTSFRWLKRRGRIAPIGAWVFETACAQLVQWQSLMADVFGLGGLTQFPCGRGEGGSGVRRRPRNGPARLLSRRRHHGDRRRAN